MTTDRDGITRRGLVGAGAALALDVGLGLAPAAAQGAGPAKVMVIRHAEKPGADGKPPYGLGPDGRQDPHGLLTRGWERAGALARFFAPRDGTPLVAGLARPTFLAAAAATAEHKSLRSMLTLGPVAALTGLVPDERFGPDQETAAAAAILARSGVGLVAWEHKRIADLVAALTGGSVRAPHWSGQRYDMVLVLDREAVGWRLTQVPQLLLAGDRAEPLGAKDGEAD